METQAHVPEEVKTLPAEHKGTVAGAKPHRSFWQIWNMCFGFLGLQFGFALQNANVSRIFQTLGASLEQIPLLWVAAPFTGLVVQPLIGYFSDRTWTRLGRRRPYFVAGAVLAATALVLMPRSLNLWMAAGLLWMLDAELLHRCRRRGGGHAAMAPRPGGRQQPHRRDCQRGDTGYGSLRLRDRRRRAAARHRLDHAALA